MGATASCSSNTGTTTRTGLVRISEYSKLVRTPVDHPETFSTIRFDDLLWEVTVNQMWFNDEGLADYINVAVGVGGAWKYRPNLVLKGIDISLEILDETEENTVYHKMRNVTELQVSRRLNLALRRRELEASSCVHDDSFTIRYTLSKQHSPKWWCPFSEPNKKLAAALEPQVAMAGSHTLTVGSFSKLKAALRDAESTYSTHFAVGGCRWYFQFCPAGIISLVCASDDITPTTAEFSFGLQGVVNFESGKMTHTFDYASSRYIYRFGLEPSKSAMHDRLIVRCRIAVMKEEEPSLPSAAIQTATTPRTVIMAEKPSLPPAAIQAATTQRTETILTPLLSAMYD